MSGAEGASFPEPLFSSPPPPYGTMADSDAGASIVPPADAHQRSNQHSRPPYNGTSRGLVIAIDFGTRFSGVAYAVLEPGEVPKIRSVTSYPGQEDQSGKTKVPSVLYYDHEGNVCARGAEVNNPEIADDALDQGWITVEWFKLLFRPPEQQHIKAPPVTLPPGKSSVDVLADFLEYLQQAAREYIRSNHVDGRGDIWDNLESKIIYVLSHPNGWDGSQQTKLRRASEIAGLVSPDDIGRARVRFVSEGEASFHWCVDSGLAIGGFRVGENIIVADAGGGTIDVSSFRVTGTRPFQIQETRPSECRLAGSVFVNAAFNDYIFDRLEGTAYDHGSVHERLALEFERAAKPLFKDPARPSRISIGIGFGPGPSEPIPSLTIKAGQLFIPGEVMKSFFEPSCLGLVDAITAQLTPNSHTIIFLVGGFAASPWLYGELRSRLTNFDVSVRRANDHLSKAVPEGAVGFYLDHYVAARVAKFTYGVNSSPIYDPKNLEHTAREHLVRTTVAGKKFVEGGFSTHLARGTVVKETSDSRIKFHDHVPRMAPYQCETTLMCYRGTKPDIRWRDEDPNNFKSLCQIKATLPSTCCQERVKRGKTYYQVQYWAVLTFGTTEFTCNIEWMEGDVTKRGPAKLVWDEG